MIKKLIAKLFLIIFCTIFIIAGIAAFWFSTGEAVMQYFKVQSWHTTPANITNLSINGDNTQVKATYTYHYKGRTFTSKQVSLYQGSDNIGSYWKDLYKDLNQQRRKNQVTAWVNPKYPEEALLDTTFRWGMLIFGLVFVLIFSGLGSVLLLTQVKKQSAASKAKDKQEKIDNARSGISSDAKNAALFFFCFSLPFLLVGLLIFTDDAQSSLRRGDYAVLITLIFPLAGFFLLRHAIKSYHNYKDIGPTRLYLDPLPPTIGGELGAYFDFNHYIPHEPLNIIVTCTHNNYRNSENNNDRILWQETITAYCKPYLRGSRCMFVLPIPDNVLPTDSEQVERGYISWDISATTNIKTDNKDIEFKRKWQIPIYESDLSMPMESKLAYHIPSSHTEQVEKAEQAYAESSAKEQIHIEASVEGHHILSDSGRSKGMAFAATLAGLIFSGAGLTMLYFALKGEWMLWLFGLIFSPVGLLILFVGIDLFARKRLAIIQHKKIHITKYWFGIALFTRTGQVNSVDDIYIRESMSSTDANGLKTSYHAIHAKCIDKTLKIAEGIEGKKTAEVLLNDIQDLLR